MNLMEINEATFSSDASGGVLQRITQGMHK
jgi:hypothetical protein